ncbi:aspartyl protease family protein At5g10770-like [Lolium rigidum]|uniref:aspartyl protease family protein At5g10770-like n=1 Tax=Lolium rigidum TaxID=89674 RepID=UPI001F5C66FC|nr:aspartyl protease family protein At5g10770-like [Lolium rigidum]
MSQCSPLGPAGKRNRLSALQNDERRLHSLFTVPVTGNRPGSTPSTWESEYHIVIGYGTPVQNLTVGFNIGSGGQTFIQCKPCGDSTCNIPAFDQSQSSSIAPVPCGSPDCPLRNCTTGSTCSVIVKDKGVVQYGAAVVTDTLTLSQSTPITTLENFRVTCLEMGATTTDSSSGLLDLSRDKHSLAYRAPSAPDTVAFSYCLPSELSVDQGFLSIGAPRPEGNVSYIALRSNTALPNMYLVRLAGLDLSNGGPHIPIPAGDAVIALHSTFTYLKPETYAALRDQFKAQMERYPAAPPMGILDTCYNFTGLRSFGAPTVYLRFDNGVSMVLGIPVAMYFQERDNPFSVGCLAFASPVWSFPPGVSAVIGTLAQEGAEMVYDVRAEKVGFIPGRC